MRIKCPDSDVYLDLPDGRMDMKFNCPSCGKVHRVTINITTPGYMPARRSESGPKKYATGEFKPIVDVPIDADYVLVEKSSDQTPDGTGGSGTAAYAAAEPPPAPASSVQARPAPAQPQGKPLDTPHPLSRRVIVLVLFAAFLLSAVALFLRQGELDRVAGVRQKLSAANLRVQQGDWERGLADYLALAQANEDHLGNTPRNLPSLLAPEENAELQREFIAVDGEMAILDRRMRALRESFREAVSAPARSDEPAAAAAEAVSERARTARAEWRRAGVTPRWLDRELDRALAGLLCSLPVPIPGGAAPVAGDEPLPVAGDGASIVSADANEVITGYAWSVAARPGEDEAEKYCKVVLPALDDYRPDPAGVFDPEKPLRFADAVERIAAVARGILPERDTGGEVFPKILDSRRKYVSDWLSAELSALNPRVLHRLDAGRVDEAVLLPAQFEAVLARFPGPAARRAEQDLARLREAFAVPGFDPAPGLVAQEDDDTDAVAGTGETVSDDPILDALADPLPPPLAAWRAAPPSLLPRERSEDLGNFYRAAFAALDAVDRAGGALPGLAPVDSDNDNQAKVRDRVVGRVVRLLDRVAPRAEQPWRTDLDDWLGKAFMKRLAATVNLRARALDRVRTGPGAGPESRAEYTAALVLYRLFRGGPGGGGMTVENPEKAFWSAEKGIRLDLRAHGTPVSVRIPADLVEKTIRVESCGFTLTADWAYLCRTPLLWTAELAAGLRRAGVNPRRLPAWEVVEGPDRILGITYALLPEDSDRLPYARPTTGRDAVDAQPVYGGLERLPAPMVFVDGRLLRADVLAAGNQSQLDDFLAAAKALRAGIAGDEAIPGKVRQALDPVLNAVYGVLEPRDYLDGDFCRRLVEGDYLETSVPELSAERKAELDRYRATLSRLEAGRPAFRFRLPGTGGGEVSVVALQGLESDLRQKPPGGQQDLPAPRWSWRVRDEDGGRTTFVEAFPDRVAPGWMLAETYPGDHAVRPKALAELAEARHLGTGPLARFAPAMLETLRTPMPGKAVETLRWPNDGDILELRSAAPAASGTPAAGDGAQLPGTEAKALGLRSGVADRAFDADDLKRWNDAVGGDRSALTIDVYGPPGFGFPPHVPVRNNEGDILALAVDNGWIENPDFSTVEEGSARDEAMNAWLARAAGLLDSPGKLSLLFRQFSRYTLDSPLPDRPTMVGSNNASGDDHQTVHQFLARKQMGRFIGDCDDLAEFFQSLVNLQGQYAFVMHLPGHAAAGWAEKPKAGEGGLWRFTILQTGPVMTFAAPTLDKVVEEAYTAFDLDGSQSTNFSTAQVPILLRFAGEQTRTPFVLAARIYGDRAYAEKMVEVQGLWHEFAFSTAIREMEEMVKSDRDIGNLKELASLYERVGFFEESAKLREDELAAAPRSDPNVRLSTLLDLSQLYHQAKDRKKALSYLERMERVFEGFFRARDGAAYARSTGFRLQAAMMFCLLKEPVRGLKLLFVDLNQAAENITRGPRGDEPVVAMPMARVMTEVYSALREGPDGKGPPAKEAAGVGQLLSKLYARGFFRPGDSYNDTLLKYSIFADYAIASAGTDAAVAKLLADGPYPTAARRHASRDEKVGDEDWEWIRSNPMVYVNQARRRLDREERPDKYDPETAKKLLEAAGNAFRNGERFGSMMIAEDDVFTARITLAFLNNDPSAMKMVMGEVRSMDFSRFYDRAAMAFGMFCGLAPIKDFDQFIDAFHDAVPGKQHYFKVVYLAVDREHFDHALAMARATAKFFPDEKLLVEEAAHVEKLIPELRRRVAEREARRQAEDAKPADTPATKPTAAPDKPGEASKPRPADPTDFFEERPSAKPAGGATTEKPAA